MNDTALSGHSSRIKREAHQWVLLLMQQCVPLTFLLYQLMPDVGIAGASTRSAVARTLAPTTMWTCCWNVQVSASPNGPVISVLDSDQQVRVTGGTVTANSTRWLRIRLWGAINGWVLASKLARTPIAEPMPVGVPVTPHPVGPQAPVPLSARAVTDGPARLRALPDVSSQLLRILPSGAAVHVVRWATDASGQAWYGVKTPATGWISADHINLNTGTSGTGLSRLRGPGMWCTPAILDVAPAGVLVAAARANRITHLYVEVGSSHSGFYGADTLHALLPVAHAAHIAVIAWVYPFLDNLPLDVSVALAAARYVAPSGDRPDGLVADVEQNMQEPYVRAYSEVLRAELGSRTLMGLTTYAPQTYWGKLFPFRIAARSWDVIIPQDYWHARQQPYSASVVYQFVRASITGIRTATGRKDMPVEVLGQTFDIYGSGVDSPTAAEITAAVHAAHDGGAWSISFFEWNHATPAEWDALSHIPR